MLIFIHIPKTAGSTINGLLKRNFPSESRFYVDPSNVKDSKNRLAMLSNQERSAIRLLHGHMAFGWHVLLPASSCRYFTLVRDPVERVVSHYSYVRYRSDYTHYLREIVDKKNMSLTEYVESGVCDELNNGQVRLLAGVEEIVQEPFGASHIPYGSNDSGLLYQALDNVDRYFDMVGIQEHFEKTLLLMEYRLGLEDIRYVSRNMGHRDYKRVQATPAERAVIESYNKLDLELYRLMARKFRRDMVRCWMSRLKAGAKGRLRCLPIGLQAL